MCLGWIGGLRRGNIRSDNSRVIGFRMVDGSHDTMVGSRMVFGVVISEVLEAAIPVDEELALVDAVLNPEVSHGHSFGTTQFDGVVSDASGGGVISLDGSGALGVAKGFKGEA